MSALRDGAIERCSHPFEALHLLKPANIGACCLNVRLLRVKVLIILVYILLGYRVCLDEPLISSGGNTGQLQIGLRLSERSASLIQFLVDFGGINQGK